MNPQDQIRQAEAALRAGAVDEAELLCRAALAAAPEEPEAWCCLGHVQRARGRMADAADCWRRALDLQPDPDTEFELGRVCNELGRYDEAAAVLRRVVARRSGWYE